jgi:hypothetical protein
MRARVPALVAALLLLLAGCGDDSTSAVAGDAASAGSTGPAEGVTTPPTGGDPASTDPAEPTDGETTAPGTELAYGDTATVSLDSYGEEAIAAWTVSSVEPGADDESGVITQYRINIRLTAVTDLTTSFILPSFDFEGLDAKGEKTLFNVEKGCDDEVETSGLIAGKTVDLCVSVASFEEGELTGVRYTAGDAYDDDKGQPIVWKP